MKFLGNFKVVLLFSYQGLIASLLSFELLSAHIQVARFCSLLSSDKTHYITIKFVCQLLFFSFFNIFNISHNSDNLSFFRLFFHICFNPYKSLDLSIISLTSCQAIPPSRSIPGASFRSNHFAESTSPESTNSFLSAFTMNPSISRFFFSYG